MATKRDVLEIVRAKGSHQKKTTKGIRKAF